jgi:class 3 adenylate cyclase
MKILVTFVVFWLACLPLGAQSLPAQRIWEIAQGANWTQFKGDAFTIGVVDNKTIVRELESFLKDKKIAGKSIEISKMNGMYAIKPANIIFVDGESTRNSFIGEVIEKVTKGGFPALVVTAKTGMLEEGSHINLLNGGAQYEVNLPEIQKVGVALNTGKMPSAIIKSVKVKDYETNNVKIGEKINNLIKKDNKNTNSKDKEGEAETGRRVGKGGDEAPEMTEQETLLNKAANEKALTDRQADALKNYIKQLEAMLDANKIDYQSLKKQYELDQSKAEDEIKGLNLTLIQRDSLYKKNALIAKQKLDIVESKERLAEADARTNFYIAIAATMLALLGIGTAYLAYRDRQIIAQEKHKSEALLLNILPAEIAQELKDKGTATPRQYELATVLFTDFKGFTNVAEGMSPEAIIQELDKCFLGFDEIIGKYNLERIKTIGDAYMCAGGVPTANKTNPVDAVKAGLEMQAFMEKIKKERQAEGKPYFECRLGIHSGRVIAGVVGKKKFAYDIWGDTVNIASRMESSGEINRINISADTYNLVKDFFVCEHRGKISAKGKGEIDMYFVNSQV